MRVSIDKSAMRSTKFRIKAVNTRANNLMPVWPKVGSYLSRSNRKQFTSRGLYYGTPWKPLQPEYALWKLHHGYGRRPLVLSGAMKTSLTSRPMSVERYHRQSAEYGTNNRLAVFHQYGTRRHGKRAIPARPMMKVTPLVRRDIRDIIKTYVTTGKVAVKDYIL